MTTLIAKVKNGRIDIPATPEFPDGSDVSVTLEPTTESLGITRDEDWHTDPESIERWIAEMNAIHREPGSEEAFLEIQQILRENREWELANVAERERKLGFVQS